ncbi:hypothetical protein ACP4OV_028220 [Aristida adscensionis]
MAAEVGEKAAEKEATREEDGEMGEKETADPEKGAMAAEDEVEEKGATAAAKGERRPRLRRRKRTAKAKGEEKAEKEAAAEASGEKAGTPFKMSEAAARQSSVLGDMIDNGCAGGSIPLPNVDARALATVIKYCDKHAAAAAPVDADHGGGGSTAAAAETLEEWDRKLVDGLAQDALYDLIGAANFLDISGLLGATCQKVADMIRGYTVEQIRRTFNITSGFTKEEEEAIRKESRWAFDED